MDRTGFNRDDIGFRLEILLNIYIYIYRTGMLPDTIDLTEY